MKILYGVYPPNYKAIAKAFDIKGKPGIVFTYGDTLYVPGGDSIRIDKPLMTHEETHVRQQKAMTPELWWSAFLASPEFRFKQELEAYRNQYRAMAALPLQQRLAYLDHIAGDLSGPMYGNMLTKEEATAAITKDIILKHVSTPGKNMRKMKKLKRQNRKKGRK